MVKKGMGCEGKRVRQSRRKRLNRICKSDCQQHLLRDRKKKREKVVKSERRRGRENERRERERLQRLARRKR